MALTVKFDDEPPEAPRADVPLLLLTDDDALFLRLAKVVSQHKVNWQSKYGHEDGPNAIAPAPSRVYEQFASCLGSSKCGDQCGR